MTRSSHSEKRETRSHSEKRESRSHSEKGESRSHSRSRSSSSRKHRHRHDRDSRSKSSKRRSSERSYRRERSKSREKYSSSRKRSGSREYRDRKDRDRRRNRDRNSRYRSSESGTSSRSTNDFRENGSQSKHFEDLCAKYQNSISDDITSANFYKTQQPNRTLMLSNIPMNVTEKEIYDEIVQQKLPKDIRLIRRKDTGESRGFAFIDFQSVNDAVDFMELKRGYVLFGDNSSKSYLQYSMTKSGPTDKGSGSKLPSDWFCIKCNEYNFKRRDFCFHCNTSRLDSELGDNGYDEVSEYPTKTVMLRNLDVLTIEDSVLVKLKDLLGDKFHLIQNFQLSKDPLTSTSRGICYLEMKNVFESVSVFNVLMVTSFTIDDKDISVTYCKYNNGDISQAVENFMNFGRVSESCIYTLRDLDQLAEYSALKYAKTSEEFDHYFDYYRKFFGEQIALGETINVNKDTVRMPEIAFMDDNNSLDFNSQAMEIPTGTDNKKYPKPDQNQFKYDEATGYHYDLSTGLYFDSSTNVYYNGVLQRYMYWDDINNTYVYMADIEKDKKESKSKKADKKSKNEGIDGSDKVKVAKKITKDLEKWAKSLNQKKEQHNRSLIPTTVTETSNKLEPITSLISHETATQSLTIDNIGLDWKKLVCILCQRQFSSKELLTKHQSASELHKKNLNEYLNVNRHNEDTSKSNSSSEQTAIKYRDRAKERRMKFGEKEPVPESKYMSKFHSVEMSAVTACEPVKAASISTPISSNNLGSKMLQKMGWTEGQGLGKQNQGRTTIIEADGRMNSAGLGSQFSVITHGETYVESAKKVMYARYQKMSEPS